MDGTTGTMHLTNTLVFIMTGVFTLLSQQTLATNDMVIPQSVDEVVVSDQPVVTEVNPVVVEENTATTSEDHITKDAEETIPGEACNCYRYVKKRIAELPSMAAVIPNTTAATGTIAIEWFGAVKHISIVTAVDAEGVWVTESNYNHCKIGTRYIPFDHYALTGFWSS